MRESLEKKYVCYELLRRYYRGEWALGMEIPKAVAAHLGREAELCREMNDFAGIPTQFVEYDYNRLFIGPGKLLAPPYAGAYLNRDGLVMQEETLAVRAFYAEAGLVVRDKNVVPDDALWLELECVCYLLRAWAENGAPERFAALYRRWVGGHVCRWIGRHAADAERGAQTEVCRAAARWTGHFFAAEQAHIRRNFG